jgi:hypothetical protein
MRIFTTVYEVVKAQRNVIRESVAIGRVYIRDEVSNHVPSSGSSL